MSQSTSSRPVFTSEQRIAWLGAKALLKSLSLQIREAKGCRKLVPHEGTYLGQDAAEAVRRLSTRYRALHIAMSLLRGQTMVQIEGEGSKFTRLDWSRLQMDARIKEWQEYLKNPGSKKLYIITDATLSPSQQAVQSAHAVAEFQKNHPGAPWVNGTLVLLKLTPGNPSEHWNRVPKLEDFKTEATMTGDYISTWREPDMGNKITAIALLSEYRNEERNGQLRGTSLL